MGFFDSFKPGWAWHEDEKAIKKRKKEERERKKEKRNAKANGGVEAVDAKKASAEPSVLKPGTVGATGSESAPPNGNAGVQQRNLSARVEEVEDE